jgi:hypothetical protein
MHRFSRKHADQGELPLADPAPWKSRLGDFGPTPHSGSPYFTSSETFPSPTSQPTDSGEEAEIYVRADPTEKLEAIDAVLPPTLRRGRFRAPDKLLASLRSSRLGS